MADSLSNPPSGASKGVAGWVKCRSDVFPTSSSDAVSPQPCLHHPGRMEAPGNRRVHQVSRGHSQDSLPCPGQPYLRLGEHYNITRNTRSIAQHTCIFLSRQDAQRTREKPPLAFPGYAMQQPCQVWHGQDLCTVWMLHPIPMTLHSDVRETDGIVVPLLVRGGLPKLGKVFEHRVVLRGR